MLKKFGNKVLCVYLQMVEVFQAFQCKTERDQVEPTVK